MKTLSALFLFFISFGAAAQTLQEAIKLVDNEQYEKARSAFKALVAKEPTNGDNFFYFGDLMLLMENADSAKVLFQKGVDINPTNAITHIGLGRYYMATGDQANGQKEMAYAKSLITTQGGKKGMNMEAPRQAIMYNEMAQSQLYATAPNYQEGLDMINISLKLDPKNTETYIIQGDLLYAKDPVNGTPAINSYSQAIKLDPRSCKAKVRIGRLYMNGKNIPAALPYFDDAIKTDPSFAPALREKGEALYQIQRFDTAQKCMAKYLTLNDSPLARYRYCLFLFKSGNFEEAIKQGQLSLDADPSTIVIYRIMGRSYLDKKDAEPDKCIESFDKFFERQKVVGTPPIIAEDFVYRARAYSKNKQDSLALLEYNKAITLDTSRKDVYFEMGTSYYIMHDYVNAAKFYKKKIDSDPAKANLGDWLAFGRSLQQNKDYAAADAAYIKAIAADPTSPYGWLYRAKANAFLDPKSESDSTKIFYEKFYTLAIGEKETYKRDLITAGKYLGGYFYIKKNFACSKAWFSFVMELDPTNTKVKEQLDTDKDIKAAPVVELSTCTQK
ncbi:hypothetical protein BH09BAC5_BH09BAC5_01000 [soil metagenome]